MNKEIIQYNDKNLLHGYQEWYWGGELWYRGNWKNNDKIGYAESHYYKHIGYYIR